MEPAAVLQRLLRAVWAAIGCGVLTAATAATAAAAPAAPVKTAGPGRSLSTTAANPDVAGAISDVVLWTMASGLGSVTSIANAGDPNLYLTLRKGSIVVWDGARVHKRAFLDISSLVSCCGDKGLLSVAFHPLYETNGLFFVSYTDKAGNLAVARYKRSAGKSDRADPKSGVVLLTVPHPSGADHHGGQLQFGPDEDLYIGVGDGGSPNMKVDNAQRDDVMLGKILRLDVDAHATRPPYYGIPPSNPFVGEGPPLDEIWAKGLRDPWRFSFDRQTGDLYIGDVGESDGQVIAFQLASSRGGENFGRSLVKGSSSAPYALPASNRPIAQYGRQYGDCAVVGGYVYRGSSDPRLSGIYFYGDYCSGRIWAGSRSWPGGQLTNAIAPHLTTFGEDFAGELYVGTETGTLYRIVSPLPVQRPPTRAAAPEPIEEPAELAPVEAAAAVLAFSAQAPAPASEPIVDSSASVVYVPVYEDSVPQYVDASPAAPEPPSQAPQPPPSPPPPETTQPPPPTTTPVAGPPPTVPDRPNPPRVMPEVPPTRDVKPH